MRRLIEWWGQGARLTRNVRLRPRELAAGRWASLGVAGVLAVLTACQIGVSTPPRASAAAAPLVYRTAVSEDGVDGGARHAGLEVYTELGCGACHRIGDRGRRRPGGTLTHIGATLSEPQIRDIVVHGASHMPAFQKLPRAKLRSLVRFLASLK